MKELCDAILLCCMYKKYVENETQRQTRSHMVMKYPTPAMLSKRYWYDKVLDNTYLNDYGFVYLNPQEREKLSNRKDWTNQEIKDFQSFGIDTVEEKLHLEELIEKWTPRRGKKIRVIRGNRASSKDDEGIVTFERLRWKNIPLSECILSQRVSYLNKDGIMSHTTGKSCIVIDPTTVTHPETFKYMEAKLVKKSEKWYCVILNNKEYYAPLAQTKRITEDTWLFPEWFLIRKGIIPKKDGTYHKDTYKSKRQKYLEEEELETIKANPT